MWKVSRKETACLVFFLIAAAMLLPQAASLRADSDTQDAPPPKPISPAERAAVPLALDYLARGPSAWMASLSRDSRFSRLRPADAEAEIETRAGPAAGARWEMRTVGPDTRDGVAFFAIEFPSGLETLLILDLVQEGTGWKIRDVRTLDEPVEGHAEMFPETKADVEKTPRRWGGGPAALLFGGIGLGVASLFLFRRSRKAALLLSTAGALALLGGIAAAVVRDRSRPAAAPAETVSRADLNAPLGSLRELRRALATADARAVRPLLERLRLSDATASGRVSRIWKAEWALREGDIAGAAKILNTFPPETRVPRVEILRGRLSFLQNRPRDLMKAYDAAIRLGPDQDGLLLEAAQLSALMGDETRSEEFILNAAHNGSRIADVSYAQSAYWIRQQQGLEAQKWFRRAWQLQPVERARLIPQAFFWDLLRRPELYQSLQLDSAREPTVRPPEFAALAIPLPSGAEASLCGAQLRFRLGEKELIVPGGASLAPAGTPLDDAGAWTRLEEREALADLPRLTSLAGSGSALLQPLLRRQVETAVVALARRHRWEDVVRLTEGTAELIDRAPSELILLRGEGLRHTNRAQQARALMERVGSSELFLRRSGPGTLFGLARLLASLDDYDDSIRIAERAASRLRVPVGKSLIRRIKMERKLAEANSTFATEHFLIRYPTGHPESGTRKLAAVLEGERERLRRWIPLQKSSGKTEVQLLWFEDFQAATEGLELAGLFDGRIQLPFAGGESLDFSHPAIVAIVTHELAHAMISELTLDSAPHWLQEGLAQHVEMQPEHFNPVPTFERRSRFLSLPVVDGVLAGLPAPDLAEASYEESLWMLHYLESSAGLKSIHTLLGAFRDGATTEEALRKVSYASVSDFDDRFRTWCRLPAAGSWKAQMSRYIGDKATGAVLPESIRNSAHRIRWNQSEEPFLTDPSSVSAPAAEPPSARRPN